MGYAGVLDLVSGDLRQAVRCVAHSGQVAFCPRAARLPAESAMVSKAVPRPSYHPAKKPPGAAMEPGTVQPCRARTEELSDQHARSVDRLSNAKNADDLCANFLERRFKELSSRIDAERR
jgi:hypothetical protein